MEMVEWAKVKYTHSIGYIVKPLNINININNERQDCKRVTECVSIGGVLVGGVG
jgi:hypothetical protein